MATSNEVPPSVFELNISFNSTDTNALLFQGDVKEMEGKAVSIIILYYQSCQTVGAM